MHTARRTRSFTESVIRGMTRLASEHGAINLAQGFPNFPAPDVPKEAAAFSARTRAIIVCTPNNPTGRVLSRRELEAIAELCRRHEAYAVTDEIYEHIYYEGEHIPIATLDGMRERTITISGASKTFSVTGWRIGTIVAPPDATDAIRKVHDFLTVGAPAPLQEAVAVGLETLGDDYYETLARDYRARRDLLCKALVDAGFRCTPPQGAYYVLADCSGVSELPDDEFSFWLTKEIGVAPRRSTARARSGAQPPRVGRAAPHGRRGPGRRVPVAPSGGGERGAQGGRRAGAAAPEGGIRARRPGRCPACGSVAPARRAGA